MYAYIYVSTLTLTLCVFSFQHLMKCNLHWQPFKSPTVCIRGVFFILFTCLHINFTRCQTSSQDANLKKGNTFFLTVTVYDMITCMSKESLIMMNPQTIIIIISAVLSGVQNFFLASFNSLFQFSSPQLHSLVHSHCSDQCSL